jgi:hypothetical protein
LIKLRETCVEDIVEQDDGPVVCVYPVLRVELLDDLVGIVLFDGTDDAIEDGVGAG